MQNFKELYKELSDKLTENIEDIRWIDLWNSQVYHLEEEHPFPTPAIFLAFRSSQMNDVGIKVQNLIMQVDVFVFYETFLDTYKGAYNQKDALAFLDIMDSINQTLHGSSGENYSSMRRIAFSPVDTGGSGNLWSITYETALVDYSAVKKYIDVEIDGVELERGDISKTAVDVSNGYVIPG